MNREKRNRAEREIGALLFTQFAIQFRIQKTKLYLYKQLQPDIPILQLDTISGTKIVHEIVCSNIQKKVLLVQCVNLFCVCYCDDDNNNNYNDDHDNDEKIPVLCVTKYISDNYTIQNEQGMANLENKNKTNSLYIQIVCVRDYFENKTPKTLSLYI